MKNITILDLDYYHKVADYPNATVMRLSSYLKQKGYVINFVETELHMKMKYDRAYVFREKATTPPPPTQYLADKECQLIGETFKYFAGHAELPPVVAIVRPDYQLYNFDKVTKMTNANFIQFFHDGKLLKKRQDYHNTKPGVNKLVVMDEDFWSLNEEDVIWVLEFLAQERHIHFKHPIRLSKILASDAAKELFLNLHFSAGTQISFKNDLGHTLPQLKDAIDFIGEVDARFGNVMSSKLVIASITANHYKEPYVAAEDFKRVIKIVAYAKTKGVHLSVRAPKSREYTPFYEDFLFFESWTKNFRYESFVTGMLLSATKKKKKKWWEILNSSNLWTTDRIKSLIGMFLNEKEFLIKYGFIRNKFEEDDPDLIDFNSLEKYRLKSSVEDDINAKD